MDEEAWNGNSKLPRVALKHFNQPCFQLRSVTYFILWNKNLLSFIECFIYIYIPDFVISIESTSVMISRLNVGRF